jgi:hypothetical protein
MDIQKFLNAEFSQRESEIPVPALSAFFGEGEPTVWKVRGLTAHEVARCRDAKGTEQRLQQMIEAMAGDGSDKSAKLRAAMGLSDGDTPQDISYRIEQLTIGSVSPALGAENRDVAVKLAEAFPIVFYTLTNKIMHLTELGLSLGKPKASGKSQTSESPQPSATKKGGSSSKRGRTSSRKGS